jgi:membrane-bound serine protease (ClpP class)
MRTRHTFGGRSRALRRAVFVLAALTAACLCLPARAEEKPQAVIMRLEGMIGDGTVGIVERGIEKARDEGAQTFVLELDTPGGYLIPSMKLSDYIFKQDKIDVVAYIHDMAYSGGTMLALACKAIYIEEQTGKMGDAAPVDETGRILGGKQQSPVRDVLTNYARARGYPEALVKAMVTREIEVFKVQMADEPPGSFTYMTGDQLDAMAPQERQKIIERKLIVPAGQLLSMDPQEAVEFGFARKAVSGPDDLYKLLSLKPDQVQRLYPSMSERLVTLLDPFTPLLIVAGFVLIFIELIHPGFGLPGILGIACFVLFFVIKVSLHYAGALEVLLFVCGLALLLIEIFLIPGFGVVGVSGIILMFIGLVLAFQRFDWPRSPEQWVQFQYNLLKVIASLAASAVGIAVTVRLAPSMPGLRRVMNVHSESEAHIGDLQESRTPGLSQMVGDVGVALTPLRPAGRAEFGDRRLDVLTEGEFVERGQRVRIVSVKGNRVVVALYREA